MPWFFFVIAGIFINACSDIVRRSLLSGKRKLDYFSTAFLLSLITMTTLLVYAIVVDFQMPPLGNIGIIFAINACIGVTSWLTSQRGLSLLGVGEFSVLMSSRQIITWILSIVFMGIGLTFVQGIGSIIIITGVIITFFHKGVFKHNSKEGLFFTLLTASMYGVSILLDQITYRESYTPSLLLLNFAANTLLLIAIRPRVVKSAKHLITRERGPAFLLYGILIPSGLVCLFTALKLADNAPLVSVMFQLQIVITVVLAALFLGERTYLKRKLLGAALATCGAVLIVINN